MGGTIKRLEVDEMPRKHLSDATASLVMHEESDLLVEINVGERSFRVTIPRMMLVTFFGQEIRRRRMNALEQMPEAALLGVEITKMNPYPVYTLRWAAWKEREEGWVPYHVGTTPEGTPCTESPRVKPAMVGILGLYACPSCKKKFLASWRVLSLMLTLRRYADKDGYVDRYTRIVDPDQPPDVDYAIDSNTLGYLIQEGWLLEESKDDSWVPKKLKLNTAHPQWDEVMAVLRGQ